MNIEYWVLNIEYWILSIENWILSIEYPGSGTAGLADYEHLQVSPFGGDLEGAYFYWSTREENYYDFYDISYSHGHMVAIKNDDI